ncbi:undecaprenyl-phosphate glucose phosphotransferase [Rheinheimera texasensis]|uniref:undecaprenyl-phosphate glucose phosphotransferase n=1 Tax=Rheinheimera texasensis TaxID=306205 RepID=UPI0032B1F2F8
MKKSSSIEVSGSSYAALYRFIDYAILMFVLLLSCITYGVSFDKNYLILLLAEILLFSYLAEGMSLYRTWRLSAFRQMIRLVVVVMVISFALQLISLFLLKVGASYSRVIMTAWFSGSVFLMVGWRLAQRVVRRVQLEHGIHRQKVAIVGLTSRGIQLAQQFASERELGFECIGFFDDRDASRMPSDYQHMLLGTVNDAVMRGQQGEYSRLYICLPIHAEARIQHIVSQLGDTTLDVYLVPDMLTLKMMQGRLSSVGDIDTISVFESPHLGLQSHFKRTFDVLFSAAVLLVLSPLFLILAVCVKLTSRGPVLFRQDRYGLDGRKIGVLKFRTMKVQENAELVVQATRNDPRVTWFGAFLRRTSLDELPQFFNVLHGEMSVVGPRPHAVAHNEQYRNQVAFYMLRHKVKPGITGWAQVNGWRGETDTLDKMAKRVEFDLYYIRHWSLWFDIKIIVKTIFKGFSGKHVY